MITMKSIFEEMGRGYRNQARIMLSQIEEVLPHIGIRTFSYSDKGSVLRAYKRTGDHDTLEIVFKAHPAAGFIDVKARSTERFLSDSNKMIIGRMYLKESIDIKMMVEKTLRNLIILNSKETGKL